MRRRLLSIAMVLFAAIPLQARDVACHRCSLCPSWGCETLEAEIQWIYLRPTSCNHDCVIRDGRNFENSTPDIVAALPTGRAHGIDPDYKSGVRLMLGYLMECCRTDVRAYYTYHRPCQEAVVYGSETIGLWPTYTHPRYTRNVPAGGGGVGFETPLYTDTIPAVASCHLKLSYDAADLQIGTRCMKGPCLMVRTYAGLHFMNLDYRDEVQFNGTMCAPIFVPTPMLSGNLGTFDTNARWEKTTWGLGPLFGVDARYILPCGLGIAGRVGIAVLAGETRAKHSESDLREWSGPGPLDVNEEAFIEHDQRGILFPHLRGSFGVNYLRCCGCFTLLLEVAYEFNTYINAIGHFRFNDERGTGMVDCYSYSLDGITVSLRVTI